MKHFYARTGTKAPRRLAAALLGTSLLLAACGGAVEGQSADGVTAPESGMEAGSAQVEEFWNPELFPLTFQAQVDGWTYEVTVGSLPNIAFETDISTSPPGEAKVAVTATGVPHASIKSLDEGRNAPSQDMTVSYFWPAPFTESEPYGIASIPDTSSMDYHQKRANPPQLYCNQYNEYSYGSLPVYYLDGHSTCMFGLMRGIGLPAEAAGLPKGQVLRDAGAVGVRLYSRDVSEADAELLTSMHDMSKVAFVQFTVGLPEAGPAARQQLLWNVKTGEIEVVQ